MTQPGRARRARRFLSAASVAAVSLSMVACGESENQSGEAESITVVVAEYSKDGTKPYWEGLAERYTEQTGIAVDLQIVSWNDIDQQTSTMIQTGKLPDILTLNVYASYAADELLYSGDEVLSEAVLDDLNPAFVESGTSDGDFYGFPLLASTNTMFYNADLLADAGVTTDPTTWEEFVVAAEKVTALGDGTVGYAQPLGPEEAQAELAIWLFNNGGTFKSGDQWTLDSRENIETLEFMRDLDQRYGVTQHNPGATNRTDGAWPLFKSGKAGFVVGFSQLQDELDADHPDINYKVIPMPSNIGESQVYGVTDYIMAFKKPGNKAALKQFFDLFYSTDEINTWIAAEGFLPVTQSGITAFEGNENVAVYLETLPNVHLTPTDDPVWDRVKLALQQSLGSAVGANGTPGEYLTNLQQKAENGFK